MSEIETEYQKRLQAWNRLEAEARFIIDQMLIESQVKHHSVIGRIKSIDSVRQKARRKEVANPVEVLEDIVGLRVVCLLRSDIEKIGSAIRKHFLVVAEDNKLDGVSVDAFGYLSVHFVVELSQDCAGPRYRGLHGIRFEIQVRTVAMDAWASLSHYLDYKTEFDVPQVLRKDFFAISGLFYVADTHFELFYKERQRSFVAAKEAVSSASVAIKELNLDTMMAFLQTRFVGRRHDDANC
jgi:putative GTP pyrophosphokinase